MLPSPRALLASLTTLSLSATLGLGCTGSIMSSVDVGGRYFPATIIYVGAKSRALAPPQEWDSAGWYDAIDQRLLTTLAVFVADQQGPATPTGRFNEFGQTIYAPVDVESKGVEFEAVGKLRDNLDLVLGYTALRLDGLSGSDTYPWVPRRTANLMLTGRPAGLDELTWGIGGRWQSSVWNTESSGFDVRQDSYAVLNGFVAWDWLPTATVRLNVNNIADEKYINTLRYSGYYGAPANYTLSFDWRFQ